MLHRAEKTFSIIQAIRGDNPHKTVLAQRVRSTEPAYLSTSILVVAPWVPNNTGSTSRYDSICRSYWICVAVLANGRHSETRWRCNKICEVPCKCYRLGCCDLVERGGGLWWLGYRETTSRCCRSDLNRGGR